jgi:hypothetical protein
MSLTCMQRAEHDITPMLHHRLWLSQLYRRCPWYQRIWHAHLCLKHSLLILLLLQLPVTWAVSQRPQATTCKYPRRSTLQTLLLSRVAAPSTATAAGVAARVRVIMGPVVKGECYHYRVASTNSAGNSGDAVSGVCVVALDSPGPVSSLRVVALTEQRRSCSGLLRLTAAMARHLAFPF